MDLADVEEFDRIVCSVLFHSQLLCDEVILFSGASIEFLRAADFADSFNELSHLLVELNRFSDVRETLRRVTPGPTCAYDLRLEWCEGIWFNVAYVMASTQPNRPVSVTPEYAIKISVTHEMITANWAAIGRGISLTANDCRGPTRREIESQMQVELARLKAEIRDATTSGAPKSVTHSRKPKRHANQLRDKSWTSQADAGLTAKEIARAWNSTHKNDSVDESTVRQAISRYRRNQAR